VAGLVDTAQIILLTVGLPILALGLHEMTHLLFARTLSPISIELDSYVPFRLRLDFHQTPSKPTLRLVALAPVLLGGAIAMVAVWYGFWKQIRIADPYYLHYIVGLNWLLYIAPSPADLQLAIWPPEEQVDIQANS
jgi:hypothetical protein